ncbi:MAG: D-2-hydroxyacid dehydrogenase [Gammaproteobacteria bacterium]|nr:MAG: D-2-hydroxyacid dehydrogenase [Gammaproteobacteria bacterium]
MRGVILDFASLGASDLDLSKLDATVDRWDRYDATSEADIDDRLASAEIVLTNKVVIGREHFESHPAIRLVVIMATGTNNVDLTAARNHGIPVCNVSGYSTYSVVQYTFACMLALRTCLLSYRDAVQQGKWQESQFFSFLGFPIDELHGATLGIVGFGAIGQAVAAVAEAFGMKVVVAESLVGKAGSNRRPLAEVLRCCDVLSLHCPLTKETRSLIGSQELACMKPTAVLINAARGGVVDERALADALRNGVIAGAAVDVLTQEPPSCDHPLLSRDIPNLILTPHIGWASKQARQRLVDSMAHIIESYKAGVLINCVNEL